MKTEIETIEPILVALIPHLVGKWEFGQATSQWGELKSLDVPGAGLSFWVQGKQLEVSGQWPRDTQRQVHNGSTQPVRFAMGRAAPSAAADIQRRLIGPYLSEFGGKQAEAQEWNARHQRWLDRKREIAKKLQVDLGRSGLNDDSETLRVYAASFYLEVRVQAGESESVSVEIRGLPNPGADKLVEFLSELIK